MAMWLFFFRKLHQQLQRDLASEALVWEQGQGSPSFCRLPSFLQQVLLVPIFELVFVTQVSVQTFAKLVSTRLFVVALSMLLFMLV